MKNNDSTVRTIAVALLVAAAAVGAADAQTVTGRIDPEWDAENERYAFGPLYWDIEVAPRSARSDEFSMYLYYNKRSAVMSAGLVCQARGEEPDDHALSFSGEHFLSLTTGLFPGDACVLFVQGFSDREEVLSYRMAVSKSVTRQTTTTDAPAAAQPDRFTGFGFPSPELSAALHKFTRAVAGRRGN